MRLDEASAWTEREGDTKTGLGRASKNRKNPIKFTRRRAGNDIRRKSGTNGAEAKQGGLHGAGEPLAHIPLTDQERTYVRELDPMGRCFSGATSKI